MNFQFALTGDIAASIAGAVPVTLALTAISFVAALLFAIAIAIIDYFRVPVLRKIFAVYVSFFRGTPLIPQLFLLYFGIPSILVSFRDISPFVACIIALTLNTAAYMKESIRGALLSVPHGQKEAALAHGMTQLQAMRTVVLPQAARIATPSLFNNLVDTVKGTSVAFTVGVIEMTAAAKLKAAVTFDYLGSYLVLMLIYWLLIVALERIEKVLEHRMAIGYTRSKGGAA